MNAPLPEPGHVYLVGAGPGDPGLISVKGAHLLAHADLVLYDEILDARLLELASDNCEKIFVGKRGRRKGPTQEQINELLVLHARAGRSVVRLKGGDPYIFGRGSEEGARLRAEGIPFEVVSGVSAASGALAYAGIPLTHRGITSTAVLVTGHEDPAKPIPSVDWAMLAKLQCTLIIFMGARRIGEVAEVLIQNGRSSSTPVSVIEWGTWPRQQTLVTTLENLAEKSREHGLQSPAIIAIGEVVKLRDQLNWFENKPLFGRRILVTRSREQAGGLRLLLETEAAEVHCLPLLEFRAPDRWDEVDRCLRALTDYHWVVFTSPNAVDYFMGRLRSLELDARALGGVRVAAVGRSTAESLTGCGIFADLIPAEQSQEGLVQAFADIEVSGLRFLLPGSSIGRPLLADELARRQATVERVITYENVVPRLERSTLPACLTDNELDLVIFASPSSVANFVTVLGEHESRELLAKTAIATIGPTTSRAIQDLGFEVAVQPQESTVPELVRSICHYFRTPA
jgi:uroporphyrinogen III methyltransferase/synthase